MSGSHWSHNFLSYKVSLFSNMCHTPVRNWRRNTNYGALLNSASFDVASKKKKDQPECDADICWDHPSTKTLPQPTIRQVSAVFFFGGVSSNPYRIGALISLWVERTPSVPSSCAPRTLEHGRAARRTRLWCTIPCGLQGHPSWSIRKRCCRIRWLLCQWHLTGTVLQRNGHIQRRCDDVSVRELVEKKDLQEMITSMSLIWTCSGTLGSCCPCIDRQN